MLIPQGSYVALLVLDNGPGIPPASIDKIFDPFFSTKDSYGSGLGLTMVKMLLDEMGAYIQLDGGENHGTGMVMYFPVA